MQSAPGRRWTAHLAPIVGLAVALLVVTASALVPVLTGWDVHTRALRSAHAGEVPPLHGWWQAKVGPGTIPAILIAAAGLVLGPRLARRLRWLPLLGSSFAVAFGWMLALALVDGPAGLSRSLASPYDVLVPAREVGDVGELLRGYISRIPADAPDRWTTQAAGHPPGLLLFFVLLVRIGLGNALVAGVVVAVVAATIVPAVMIALRALGAEDAGRRIASLLALSPAAVFSAVSDDAVIAAAGAWGIALLALSASRDRRMPQVVLAILAGLVLAAALLTSYGMVLLVPIAAAVVLLRRAWVSVIVAAASAAVLLVVTALAGFPIWEAFPVLRERYWAGIASARPYGYWVWANLGALLVSAGPALGAGIGALAVRFRTTPRAPALLAAGAAVAIVAADLSGLSLSEVERIWLPFIPWLSLALVSLDARALRIALGIQVVWALLVQHLVYTSW